MSEAAYQVTAHPRAKAELDGINPDAAALIRRYIREASRMAKPTDHRKVDQLTGFDDLLKVKIRGYRAICRLDKPEFRLLLVDKRRVVYDRLDVAEERGGVDG